MIRIYRLSYLFLEARDVKCLDYLFLELYVLNLGLVANTKDGTPKFQILKEKRVLQVK